MKNNKGFTGVDVAIGVIIFTIFISVVAAMFYNISTSQKRVERKAEATNIAINVIESMKAMDFYDLEEDTTLDDINNQIANKIDVPNGYKVTVGVDNTTYKDVLKILSVKVEYENGNQSEDVNLETLVKNLNPMPDGEGTITMAHTPTEWTNENVTATATPNLENIDDSIDMSKYQIQMSKDNKDWETVTTLEVEQNGTIYARFWDGEKGSSVASHEITNIDKVKPTIDVEPETSTLSRSRRVTITVGDEGGSGLSNSNIYEYYLSTSQTEQIGSNDGWQPYTSGERLTVGEGLTGTYYIHVRRVKDIAGNESEGRGTTGGENSSEVYGPYEFSNEAPIITIDPNEHLEYAKTTEVTITVKDQSGSGLNPNNAYQYYLSTSPTEQIGNNDGWQTYTSGQSFPIGTGLTGTYYLHVKPVSDTLGNTSEPKISGEFRFDNIAPTVEVTPGSSDAVKSTNITITATDSGGSGLDNNIQNYQYYLSTSPTDQIGGEWENYSLGSQFEIGDGLNGTYYLHIKGVSDNAGNTSQTKITGPYIFINAEPVITINPNGNSEYTKTEQVTITVEDKSGSGLSASNSYQYCLSTSPTYSSYGDWQPYESGEPFTIGTGLTGTYYLHVKPIYDNLGNSSGSKTSEAFYFDNSAPTIVISPNYSYNYARSTNVTITVQESGESGLSNSNIYEYYLSTSSTTTTGGDGWHTYSRGYSFPIGEDLTGIYYIHVRGVSDNAGNSCANKVSGAFYFDNTAPTITVSPTSSSTPSRSVSVTIRASDNNSGLSPSNRYQYCLSTSRTSANGSWTSYSNGNSTPIGAGLNGTYYLHVRGVSDNAGNSCSNYVTGPYVFANEAPTITISPDGNGSYSRTESVTINVTDNSGTGLSSSNSYQYCLSTSSSYQDGTWKTYTPGSSFPIGSGLNGIYYIHVRGVSDNAGNTCDNKVSGAFYFDNKAPTISFNPNGGSSVSSVRVSISDSRSGLQSTSFRYCISSSSYSTSGGNWQYGYLTNGSATISLSGQSGTKYIHIDTVSDIAGNISTAVSNSFQFDNEAPKITISPNSQSSYTKSTSVTITVEDDGELSSSNEYEYYISTSSSYNSYGNWQPYESGEPFTIGTGLTGTYYIHVKSVEDNAGNSSGTKTSGAFYFDNTAPVVSATAPSSSAVTSQNVTINVSDTGGSGLSSNSYQYYLSSSSTSFSEGSWTNYTRGYSFPIGTGLNGQYYLFVKRVSDNCGNTSTYNGTLTYIGGTQYHRFGPYTFANVIREIQVGDYVDYDPTVSDTNGTAVASSKLSYTSPKGTGQSHGNGNSNQIFTAKSSVKWKVLTIGNDTVELISSSVIKTDAGGNFVLRGPIGYLYAEQELHEACKIYGYGYGADTSQVTTYGYGGPLDGNLTGRITGSGARSIIIEDINKQAGITTEQDFKALDSAYGSTANPTTDTLYPTIKTQNGISTSKGARNTKYTRYSYYSSKITDPVVQNMLYSSSYYYSASRCIICSTIALTCEIFIGSTPTRIVRTDMETDFGDFSISHAGIRPIVTLKLNTINKEAGYDENNGGWKLK